MSVFDDISAMPDRLSQVESETIKKCINLYSSGVSAKLKNAEYSFERLKKLSPINDETSSSTEIDFTLDEKIQFYVDAFFAFLYSSFDVIAHVINQKYHLRVDERSVSFNSIRTKIDSISSATQIKSVIDTIKRSRYFKNLDKYRNCSTHRRQIYIRSASVTIYETPGYSATDNLTHVQRFICDDPLTLHPTISQKRELISYCEDVLEKVKLAISKIAENI